MDRTSAGADSHGLPRFALNGSYAEAVSNSCSRPGADVFRLREAADRTSTPLSLRTPTPASLYSLAHC